jgi:hypothetical protein
MPKVRPVLLSSSHVLLEGRELASARPLRHKSGIGRGSNPVLLALKWRVAPLSALLIVALAGNKEMVN